MTLNHQAYPLIPDEAFLFFPKQTDIVHFKNGQSHRIFFDGGIHFTPEEYKLIS